MATPEELDAVRDRLLGLIDESRIRAVRIARPAPEVIARFSRITDLTSTVSDALDALGVGSAIPGHVLVPLAPGQRICGPAVTIRYAGRGGTPGAHYARDSRPLLADRDLYGVGQAGDVAVFDAGGAAGTSVMGNLSALWAVRLGIAGCIVDGGVRDIASIRTTGPHVWSRGRTPITGRHRVEAVEINGTVAICGAQVRPGDLIAADDSGVCIVPFESVDAVIAHCEAAEGAEEAVTNLIKSGAAPADVTRALSPERW
ncbi:MAG: RraA family protein [Candidatus Dormiibacterota bacterium]